MLRVLITGANGFVGQHLLKTLKQPSGFQPVAGVRTADKAPPGQETIILNTIGRDPVPNLAGIDVIVHCAARVHVMRDSAQDPLEEFRRYNVAGTIALAERAARDGVKRFVFLSSIKVNGESTVLDKPFTAQDRPAPVDSYGISKAEAETALHTLGARTGMEIVVVRPVLVYGPGVKGNFASMLNWVQRGIPLPLASVDNKRSLISVDNLCDLLVACARAPQAAGQTFLAADAKSLSTTEMLRLIGGHMGKPPRLFSVPPELVGWLARLSGRYGQFQRLFGTLEADITYNRDLLAWTPPQSTSDGLMQTAKAFATGPQTT